MSETKSLLLGFVGMIIELAGLYFFIWLICSLPHQCKYIPEESYMPYEDKLSW